MIYLKKMKNSVQNLISPVYIIIDLSIKVKNAILFVSLKKFMIY